MEPHRRAAGAKGARAYAVGDVHGRLDLLDRMLDRIEDDARSRPRRKTWIVFLGDLVDRGPDSAGVVERLRTYRPTFAKTVFLMGNHEEALLRVLGGEDHLLGDWLKFGGAQCATSYGVDPNRLARTAGRRAVDLLKANVPDAHVDFLSSFVDTVSFGDYLFVHAGIRPGVLLADQEHSDLRWIRQPFLDDCSDHGMMVVHGHTIAPNVDVRSNRIGIDTGAYRTGKLTALAIEDTERWFLDVQSASGDNSETDGFSTQGV